VGDARVDQVSFVQGQLDPRVQTRVDFADYYKSAQKITNALVIPQGGIQRRWGTTYTATCTTTNPLFLELSNMIYNNDLVYLFRWEANNLYIYLENLLIATVATQYANEDIDTLRFTQVETRLIVVTGNYAPQQLVRSSDAPVAITGFAGPPNNTLTAATGYAQGLILPVQFATGGVLPTTSPQIFAGRDYFIKIGAANTFQIFSSTADAVAGINAYTITALGALSTVAVQNTWTISNITFVFVPAYDFTSPSVYLVPGFTFTPSATSGTITITASAAVFTPAMVGGLYEGNGGVVRLIANGGNSPTVQYGFTVIPFPNTNAIQGQLSFLGEPAWSAIRGWPSTASFFQNRLFLANTASIPNGQWLSVVNSVYDFDDSEALADNAIDWYPASGDMSYIQSATSTRSLVVHTNTGNYSTPVQAEIPLTPTNYVLTEQNKFGVGTLQPVFIDNQIFFVDRSGNSIINMIWEFAQSSYVTNNISVKASSLVNNPVDMAAFSEPNNVDGFYVLFANSDGTLCVLQTLHEENIIAFSLSTTNTYPVNDQNVDFDTVASNYVKVTSALNRCWFGVQRSVPTAQAPVAITGFNAGNNSLTAANHGMPVGTAALITFTTAGVLPATNPQIVVNNYYWALALDANTFQVYGSESNATALDNPPANVPINVYTIINAGVNSNVVYWPLMPSIWIEEANFDYYTDASKRFTYANPAAVITGLDYLNGQVVQVVGDGYVLANEVVVGGQITIEQASSVVTVGLGYTSTLTPLPPVIPGVPGMLYRPKHIRNIYISYYETIGATVQGFGMPVIEMQQVIIGQLPVPQTGTFEYTLMSGWEGAGANSIVISQSAPLPMTILSLSYILEI
jgi:hypothetical protein